MSMKSGQMLTPNISLFGFCLKISHLHVLGLKFEVESQMCAVSHALHALSHTLHTLSHALHTLCHTCMPQSMKHAINT